MNQAMFRQYQNDTINKYELLCSLAERADNSSVYGAELYKALIVDLMTTPAVSTVADKTAHWIDRTDWLGTLAIYKYECSNCGFTIGHRPFQRRDGKGDKFCEECGCRMSLESEE